VKEMYKTHKYPARIQQVSTNIGIENVSNILVCDLLKNWCIRGERTARNI